MTKYILTREFINHSEMLPVDPECIDITLDTAVDRTEGSWNEYYAIFERDEFGEVELVYDTNYWQDAVAHYKNFLYEEYKEQFDGTDVQPLGFVMWQAREYPKITAEMFKKMRKE